MDARQKQILEYRSFKKGYYHLCTDGKTGKLFYTIEQYAYIMCSVALLTIKYGVQIYSFELMPTHIHIILSGTGAQSLECFFFLIERIRKRLKSDGYPVPPDSYWFKLIPITDKDSLRRHIVYLARNRYERGDCTPVGHMWGTGYLVYNQLADLLEGTKIKDIPVRKVKQLTGTFMKLPPDWEIHPVLGILPRCFVNTSKVLELFPSVKDYMTAMIKDYESYVKIAASLDEDVQWDPSEVKDIVNRMLMEDYRTTLLRNLTNEQKGIVAVKANEKYGIPIKLLAHTLFVPEHIIVQMINSKDYGTKR